MITDERLQHLSFLLTFPSLAIACAVGDEPTSTSVPPVVDPTNDDDTDDEEDTASPPSDTGDPGVTSDGADAPGTTDDAGSGTTTDDPYAETTGGVPVVCDGMRAPMIDGMVGMICTQYVAHRNVCYSRNLSPECIYFYELYCQYWLEYSSAMYGNDCASATEEFYACLSQLPCEVATDEEPDCLLEEMALDQVCT
jgi:hypothetical protein